MATRPRIGMIGDGNVGSALRQGLTRAGYQVDAVGREPERVREIASRAEVIVLAVPFEERANALREMGDAIRGKTIVDATNAVTKNAEFAATPQRSGAEELQQMAHEARVIKAFNTVFAEHMSTGQVRGEPLTIFGAGDDSAAKRTVLDMGKAIGFDTVDAGPLRNARWLEALGYFNMQLGHNLNMGPAIGFRLVHEAGPGARQTETTPQRR